MLQEFFFDTNYNDVFGDKQYWEEGGRAPFVYIVDTIISADGQWTKTQVMDSLFEKVNRKQISDKSNLP